MDPFGKFLYLPTGNPNITSFSIDASTGSLAPLAQFSFMPEYTGTPNGSGYFGSGALALDCTGRFLYVTEGYAGQEVRSLG